MIVSRVIQILLVLPFLFCTTIVRADDEAIETGRLLAILLDCGRVTVNANQSLINDPDKSDKGFTPEVFERQVIETFKVRTGIDLTDLTTARVPESAKPLLMRLLEESKKTIASYQPAINIPGIKYKGLIPATFGTETSGRFQGWSGVYMKQTAPLRLLRNQKNKPDEFEAAALQRMVDSAPSRNSDDPIHEIVDGGKTVRVLLPLYYNKECLSCHGEPKGQRDITGYPKEGGRVGELGGAISVKLELK